MSVAVSLCIFRIELNCVYTVEAEKQTGEIAAYFILCMFNLIMFGCGELLYCIYSQCRVEPWQLKVTSSVSHGVDVKCMTLRLRRTRVTQENQDPLD
jgi:hypothetical protein